MKYLIIDNRMRDIEKNALINLGYNLIEIPKNKNVYEEISSHVDIFMCKVKEELIIEKSIYQKIKYEIQDFTKIEEGNSYVSSVYPEDIKYNVCIFGNKAIHNFKYTDSKILYKLKTNNFELINVKQGYSNCSIAVIDDNSVITSDKGIYNKLKLCNIDVLLLENNLNIKLLDKCKFSQKNGFIGGAISRIGENIVIFGDLNKIDENKKIEDFIKQKELNIIDFKGLDVIDYGGIVEI